MSKAVTAGLWPWCRMLLLLPLLLVTLRGQAQPELPTWDNPPATALPVGVEHRSFHSATLNTAVGYNLLLPPSYADNDNSYPVLYWLHGVGGNENSSVAPVAPQLAAAMAAGTIPPCIVVFINGADYSFYADSADGSVPAETVFIRELLPHVDTNFRTRADRSGRAIEGFSMGGFGALAIAMKHADLFASVVAYAPALLEVQEGSNGMQTLARAGGTHEGGSPMSAALADKNRRTFLKMFNGDSQVFAAHSPWALVPVLSAELRTRLPLRIVTGTSDGLWNSTRLFRELLGSQGYDHEFAAVQDVAHDLSRLYEAQGLTGIGFHARAGNWQ